MNTQYQSNIHEKSLIGLSNGIDQCAEVVKKTLGAKGTNVVIERDLYPGHEITNDGATIILSMHLSDPVEKIGLDFLKEAVERSNSNSGDGSSTTTILLNAILKDGIASGEASMDIKRSLDECLPIIEKKIDEQTKTITVDTVESVATIAGESKSLGELLSRIYKQIGKDGLITIEGSNTYSTSFSVTDGVRFSGTGYLSPFMVHDEVAVKEGKKETRAVYERPTILVTKKRINYDSEISPLLDALVAKGKKDLVIFTDDMDSNVASRMIATHRAKVMNILIIKAPVLWKNYVFEDFAKVTGSTIVEDSTGITFKNLTFTCLGTCDKIIVDKEDTVVIGGADISSHIRELETREDTDSKLRISWLNTKTAILKLGASSETELSYLRLKAEDAVHSAKLALQHGIVAGGGVCLRKIAQELPETIGGRILKAALDEPFRQILLNAGVTQLDVPCDGKSGIDVSNMQQVDMFDAGIVDAAMVIKNAVKNALGIASTILTCPTVITLPPKTDEQLKQEALVNQHMKF